MMRQRTTRQVLLSSTAVLIGMLMSVLLLSSLAAAGFQKANTDAADSPPYDWMGESNQAGAFYGESVRSAGDVNNDGYDDILVGAWQYNSGATQSGKVFLYYGTENGISLTQTWSANPPQIASSGFFGGIASPAGDVNNDTYDDIMVSMVNYDSSYSDEGAVFVWYGSETGPDSDYDWMARGDATYAHLGWDAGPAGDVNDDGYDDIIVGAYRYDSGSISHAYVWYGSDSGLNEGVDGTPSNAEWTATTDQHCGSGTTNCSAFGTRVGSAGDVNDDGYDDIFVGAPRYDNDQSDEGVVFVWHGSDTGLGASGTPSNADWTAESDQVDGMLGAYWDYWVCSIDSAGDVNGDGYDDIIIGANMYDNPSEQEGAAFLWYGSEDGLNEGVAGTPANADWMVESNQAGAHLGTEVSSAGDFNNDGYDDVMVGAPYYDIVTPTINNAGMVMIWYGSDQGLGPDATPIDADWYAHSDQGGSMFGFVVDSAGDVNNDGRSDVLVGAYGYDNPEVDEGAAFVYLSVEYNVFMPMLTTGP